MELKWHLLPDDVSFSNIETKERDCTATSRSGRYRVNASSHPDDGPWVTYSEDNDAASLDQVGNAKGAAENGPPPKWYGFDDSQNPAVYEPGGEFEWIIPWNWRVTGINRVKGSGTNLHHTKITEDGIMTIDKLGQSTTDAGGPYGPF